MAQVANGTQFVDDVNGIRRRVVGGQPVPNGLFEPGAVDVTETDIRTLARPVVDEAASQPSGTAADPNGGISFEHSEAVQADAREQGSGSGSGRRSRAKASE
jgi:hypothetical protein